MDASKDVEVHLPNFILVHYVIRHKIIGKRKIRHLKNWVKRERGLEQKIINKSLTHKNC